MVAGDTASPHVNYANFGRDSLFTEAFFTVKVICLPTLKVFESTRKQLWNISCKKEKHVLSLSLLCMFPPSSKSNPCHSYFLVGIICGSILFPVRDHLRTCTDSSAVGSQNKRSQTGKNDILTEESAVDPMTPGKCEHVKITITATI